MSTSTGTRRSLRAAVGRSRKWIRALSPYPIVLGLAAGTVVVLNVVVPQLEVVASRTPVSMSPQRRAVDAGDVEHGPPVRGVRLRQRSRCSSWRATSRSGEDAHDYYDGLIEKLRADAKHVQHIQDFWGDPLTEAGAQSNDGKAAYVAAEPRREHGRDAVQRVGRGGPRHRRRVTAAARRARSS